MLAVKARRADGKKKEEQYNILALPLRYLLAYLMYMCRGWEPVPRLVCPSVRTAYNYYSMCAQHAKAWPENRFLKKKKKKKQLKTVFAMGEDIRTCIGT